MSSPVIVVVGAGPGLGASVARRYGLDAISDALKAASQGGRGGKIVLVPNGDPPSN